MVGMVQYEGSKDKVTIPQVFVDNYCCHSLYFSATVKLNELIALETPPSLYKPSTHEGLSTLLDIQVVWLGFSYRRQKQSSGCPQVFRRAVCRGVQHGFQMWESISGGQHSMVPV